MKTIVKFNIFFSEYSRYQTNKEREREREREREKEREREREIDLHREIVGQAKKSN